VHNFDLICLDRNTGDVLWQQTAQSEVPHEGHRDDHSFASHTPVTDGQHIYAWFGSRGLHCYNMDGKKIWSRDVLKMRTRNAFGEASSPAIHGDTIVVNCDHEGQSEIFALNKNTGETIWSKKRDEATTWVTPLIIEVDGKAQVIISATNRTRAYDLATGDTVWECGGQTTNVIPTPVSGFGNVYATSGYQGNSLQSIQLGHTGDITNSDKVKMLATRDTPYVPSPLLYGENLYILSKNDGIVTSFNAKTGEPLMGRTRLPGMTGVYASPVGANGNVYLPGRYGKVIVFKNGAALDVVATNELEDDFNASPAIVDDQIFLRGANNLYCISER
jgi:outer membrane protein assembly factor BamB